MSGTSVTVVRTGPLVIGTGIAGLSTALGLDGATLMTGDAFASGSSDLAQGGIAAAVGEADEPGMHADDTIRVAGGIADRRVASIITDSAADRIDWLADLGAHFDRSTDDGYALGREAGHSARRIVHAGGDGTGAEVMRALRSRAARRADIDVIERHHLIDLIRADGSVVGALAIDDQGALVAFLSPAVVLATGGLGRVYAKTTNPPEVAGAGLAVAARAGATLADLEFVQFHPTALSTDMDPLPLLTEALRGEGATLVTATGHRFMTGEHPDAELAPRDVVARAIWSQIESGNNVYLDATGAVGATFPERFPTVWTHARTAGIDPRIEPIPVTPAEHFHMGGIATDVNGRTSLPGLWAVGEVASTGLHGANRLASNSLLEGLVVGARAARSIHELSGTATPVVAEVPLSAFDLTPSVPTSGAVPTRELMWRNDGIVRDRPGLEEAIGRLSVDTSARSPLDRDLRLVGRLIAEAALARTESRGGHYRRDHPETDPSLARRSLTTPLPSPRTPIRLRRWSAA